MIRFLPRIAVWLGVMLSLTGCQPGNRLEQKVPAQSALAFELWKEELADNFTPAERAEFNDLLQEIRFEIMASHEASSSAAVDEAVRGKINGRSLAEAVDLGFETKLSRLERERASLQDLVQSTVKVHARPGDHASADYLAHRREDHAAQLEKNRAAMDATEAAYVRWFGHSHEPHQASTDRINQKPTTAPSHEKV